MNQPQKFPAFIEQQAAKVLSKCSLEMPVLLPKPKRKLPSYD